MKKNYNLLIYALLIILVVPLISSTEITSFTNSLGNENFSVVSNTTRYILIPAYTNVYNTSLNVFVNSTSEVTVKLSNITTLLNIKGYNFTTNNLLLKTNNLSNDININNTYYNGISGIAGSIGGAYDFDGTNKSIKVNINVTIPNASICYKIYLKNTSYQFVISFMNKFVSDGSGYTYLVESGGNAYMQSSSGSVYENGVGNSILQLNKWTNYCIININLSVNKSSTETSFIYGNNFISAPQVYSNLSLDDIKIYNRTLTIQEIVDLNNSNNVTSGLIFYDSADELYNTAGYHSIEAYKGVSIQKSNPKSNLNYSYKFNGLTNYLSIKRNASMEPGNFTITGWAYANEYNADKTIWDNNNIMALNQTGVLLYVDSTKRMIAQIGDKGTYYQATTTSTMAIGSWYHFALMRNDTDVLIYINGALAPTSTSGTNKISYPFENTRIGAYSSGGGDTVNGGYWNGSLSDIRLWNRPLTASEINYIYRNTSDSTLISLINFSSNINSLTENCTCFMCGMTDEKYCYVPITFYSNESTTMGYSGLDISYNLNFELSNCSTRGVPSKTYYIRDEQNNSLVTATIDGLFYYNMYGVQYLYREQRTVNNFSVCIYPPSAVFTGNTTINYLSDTHPQRRYAEAESTFSQSTSFYNLYLLDLYEGITVRFRSTDQFDNPLPNTQIMLEINNISNYFPVQQEVTDDLGLATFFANPDNNYRATFSKSGYATSTYSLTPTSSDIITVIMESQGSVNASPTTAGINVFYYPSYNYINNNTGTYFGMNISSSIYNISRCTHALYNGSQLLLSYTPTNNGTVCNVTFYFDTNGYSSLTNKIYYEIDNKMNYSFLMEYSIFQIYKDSISLMSTMDNIKAYSGYGMDGWGRMFLSFLFLLCVILYFYNAGGFMISDISGTIIIWLLTFLASYLNLFTVNYSLFPAGYGLNQYFIFYIVTLLSVGYIINKLQE